MKTRPNILDVASVKRLAKGLKNSTRGRYKYKIAAMKFLRNIGFNIIFLKELIMTYEFINKGYSVFTVKDKKKREVHAPCFTDKVVQHSINNAIRPMLESTYIEDSYACIKNRGPQKAIHRLRRYQLKAFKKYKYPMLVKIDISKFFYTINRDKVFSLMCKRISCQDLRILLAEKLKFTFSPRGLPLGNLTSQQFANMLLNEFDQYIKNQLKIEYYVRYADDIFIIVDGKDRAKNILDKCTNWLSYDLDLRCNPKKCYYEPATTIVALGYKITYNKKLRNNILQLLSVNKNSLYRILTQKTVKDKSIKSIMLITDKRSNRKTMCRPITLDDTIIRLNSWAGHARLAKLDKFINRTMARVGRTDIVYENGKFRKA